MGHDHALVELAAVVMPVELCSRYLARSSWELVRAALLILLRLACRAAGRRAKRSRGTVHAGGIQAAQLGP